ncbi:MAG: transcriptional regulator [Alphaproteobacteria bacterium HGW-Alphaproteobacteria-12]|nr:MAG: transcriptional regulator [Alphaproteobacteria bacterium HGW-Alphaproteobacteria-12]
MDRQLHTDNDAPPPRDGQDALGPRNVTFSITELAEEFGLTTRAIRFYEDKGLLSPERRGQVRIYHPRDRARLILIVRGKNVGLALAEIKEILSLYDLRDGCETQNQVAVDKFRKRISLLREQRREIDLQISALDESCARLEAYIAGQGEATGEVETPSQSVPKAAPKAARKATKTRKAETAIV